MKVHPAKVLLFPLALIFSMIHYSCRDKGIMCTEEYRMLTVSVIDSNSIPVNLGWYKVRKKSTGEILDFSVEDPYMDSINRLQGIYTIFTDGKMSMTTKEGMEFEFLVMQASLPVVLESYVIGKDDCHVLLRSGKTEIIF